MHPIISYELAKARIAELHSQARRDALARAARQARRAHNHQPGHPAPAHPATVIDRLLAALGARKARDPRPPRQHRHGVQHRASAARGPGDVAKDARDPRQQSTQRPEVMASSGQIGEPDHDH